MVQIHPRPTFITRNCSAKKEKIPKMVNDWKNSHPLAENNQAHQAEVMQFSYENTRVVNIRSVFSTIHRSTLAPNTRTKNAARTNKSS